MKAIFSILILAGCSIACTSAGTERNRSVPADVLSESSHSIEDTVHLAFVGDVMPGTTYPKEKLPYDDGKNLFRDVKSLLNAADIVAGNIEGVLADTGTTTKKNNAINYAFRIPVRYGAILRDAGFTFLSMANNHTFDFGLPGVKSTEKVLSENGIGYAGIIGRKESVVIEKNGLRYGFCAVGHNAYTMKHGNRKAVAHTIKKLKEQADIVIVSFHGGAEGTSYRHLPVGKEMFLGEDRGDLRSFAHFCIDSGADVVYGHGPHVVRAVELYKNHFIAYSLGNFCTPKGINITGISGYAPVLQLWISQSDGQFIKGKINSFIQKYGEGPRKDTTNAVAKEIRSLTSADIKNSHVIISNDGTITKR